MKAADVSCSDVAQAAPLEEPVVLPVSFGQELLWLIDSAVPGSSAYNVPRTRRLLGPLDLVALRRAFDDLVERHEILRTTYAFRDDAPVQVIHPARPVDVNVIDLSGVPELERVAELQALVLRLTRTPFELTREAPLRVTLARLRSDEYVLHIDTHHIASDGGSREILFRDLDALYTAHVTHTVAALPALPIQYADYAVWEREHLSGERLDGLLRYWREELAGAEFVLEMPTDFPRPAVAVDDATTASILLTREFSGALRHCARRHGGTLYMIVLAAFEALLHRYSGQPDVLVGSPVAGRNQAETEGLIGYFASMIVQRGRFAGDPTFAELLAQVRETSLAAHEHAEIPFERLVLDLQPAQQLSHSPLFQATFTSVNSVDTSPARLGDLVVLPFGNELATTKFDLSLFMTERAEGLALMLRARTALWTRAGVERLLSNLHRLLEAAVADPAQRVSQLPMLSPSDQAKFTGWNATSIATGEATAFPSLFDAVAARVPDRRAIVAEDGQLTFGELRRKADRLARTLDRYGVGVGSRAGILLDRSADTVVALLAIAKTGAAYVPLSPDVPAVRRDDQLLQAAVEVVVTVAAHAASLPAGVRAISLDRDRELLDAESDAPFVSPATADGAAYVLFTSGSTGVPKGVVVSHRNIVHYARAISRVLGGVPAHVPGDGFAALDGWHFASVSTLAADLGNTAVFPALCAGGTLHLIPTAVSNDPRRFAEYFARHAVDVLKITPGHLRALLPDGDRADVARALPKRWLVTGGETLGVDLAERLLDVNGPRLLNHYGPTETTVGACAFAVTRASLDAAVAANARSVPVGRPLANTRCFVLDVNGAVVPAGVPGELFIAGDGVASGYLGRPDLTAERFIEHPAFGRMYRTGDRVRFLPDGALEFLGRVDGQVKVRGNRVELGEVEAALLADPRVAQAAARTWDDAGGTYLAAYVVRSGAAGDAQDAGAALQALLAARLPDYMVPRSVVFLDALPLNANGKVDRRALPLPDLPPSSSVRVAPRSDTEATLATIWGETLQRDQAGFGVTDDFLALGGHSLLAMRILGKVNRRFTLALPLRTLFDAPTIAQLAEIVDLEVQLAALEGMSEEEAADMLAGMRDDGAGAE